MPAGGSVDGEENRNSFKDHVRCGSYGSLVVLLVADVATCPS